MRFAAATFLVLLVVADAQNWRPVVLMHGLTASKQVLEPLREKIEKTFPGIYVKNVEIDNGGESSLFTFMGDQVAEFAKHVQEDPKLQKGFNAVVHFQGGLILAGYISRYNSPKVHNLVTWASPLIGQYGVPKLDLPFLDKFFDELMHGNLSEPLQRTFSFASYWRSPLDYDNYLKYNLFLADVLNERPKKNETYRRNWLSLNHLHCLWSPIDEIIKPPQSGAFETYTLGQAKEITPLRDSTFYKEDWIGIQTLDKQGKLTTAAVSCKHADFPRACLDLVFAEQTAPWLNNTLNV